MSDPEIRVILARIEERQINQGERLERIEDKQDTMDVRLRNVEIRSASFATVVATAASVGTSLIVAKLTGKV